MHLLDSSRWHYLLSGVGRFWRQPRTCPCCGYSRSTPVDRKLVYTLRECQGCHLLYRHPYETAEEMAAFYQTAYEQSGLTTDLPGTDELERLKATHFKNTSKDASGLIEAIRALGVAPGGYVLDYGANWGYTAFQLQAAGYRVEAYEVSRPRAEYGRHLGIDIITQQDRIPSGFDIVYSGHVLEHVADPLGTLRWMYARVRPGGFVLAHTPNGSEARRRASFSSFHLHWGMVHPVLLGDRFLATLFPEQALFLSSKTDPGELQQWGGKGRYFGRLDGEELFLAVKRLSTETFS